MAKTLSAPLGSSEWDRIREVERKRKEREQQLAKQRDDEVRIAATAETLRKRGVNVITESIYATSSPTISETRLPSWQRSTTL
jgi:hypothetical protein